MVDDAFRSMPGLQEELDLLEESLRGRLAFVVESAGHMVRVRFGVGQDDSLAWYAASVRNLLPGTPGFLMPLRGGKYLFVPSGKNIGPPSSFFPYGGWLVNRWMYGQMTSGQVNTSVMYFNTVAGRTYGVPFVAPEDAVVDQMGCYVNTPASGGQLMLGIFAAQAGSRFSVNGDPMTQATIGATTAGTKTTTVPSVELRGGELYWLALVTSHAMNIAEFQPAIPHAATPSYSHTMTTSLYRDGTFSLSSPSGSFSTNNPIIGVRRGA